jgi:hypothetical protein
LFVGMLKISKDIFFKEQKIVKKIWEYFTSQYGIFLIN